MQISEEKKLIRKKKIARIFSILAFLMAFVIASFVLKEAPMEAHAQNVAAPVIVDHLPGFGGGRYYSEQEMTELGYLNHGYINYVEFMEINYNNASSLGVVDFVGEPFNINDASDSDPFDALLLNDASSFSVFPDYQKCLLSFYYYLPTDNFETFLWGENLKSKIVFIEGGNVYNYSALPMPEEIVVFGWQLLVEDLNEEDIVDYINFSSYPYIYNFMTENGSEVSGWFSFKNLSIKNGILGGSVSQHKEYSYNEEDGYTNIPLVFSDPLYDGREIYTGYRINFYPYAGEFVVNTSDFVFLNGRIVNAIKWEGEGLSRAYVGYNNNNFELVSYRGNDYTIVSGIEARENILGESFSPIQTYDFIIPPWKTAIELYIPALNDELWTPNESLNFFDRVGAWLQENWSALVGGLGLSIIGGLLFGPVGAIGGGLIGAFGLNSLLGNLGIGGTIFDSFGLNTVFSIIFVVFLAIVLFSILKNRKN